MPIELKCPSCGQTLRVPDDAAGKHARCAECQAVILVPTSEASSPTPLDPPLGGPPQPPSPGPLQPVSTPHQDVNPFQSPASESFQAKPEFGGFGPNMPVRPQAVDVGSVINRAFELWKENLGLLVGITVVVTAVNIGASFVVGALQGANDDALFVLSQVLNIASSVLQIYLGIGQAQIMLRLARNQPAEFGQLFGGGPLFLPVLGGSLLAGLGVAGGLILCVVPGIILMVLGWPFYWLIVDKKVPVLESFPLAFDIGKQNVGTTIIIWLASFGIMLLGLMACLVGIVFAAPLIGMMYTVGYLMMAGQIKT